MIEGWLSVRIVTLTLTYNIEQSKKYTAKIKKLRVSA